ncbi:MAG: FtsX-like permease family protein, partial [Bacteroidota bacterium]
EIGIRKVVGSQKRQLIGQFLTEALLVTFLSFIISLGLTHLFIFLLNNLFQEQLLFEALLSLKQLGILLLGVLLLGVLSGLYPAFVLSRFNTHHIIKGAVGIETKGTLLRKGLTVFQFFVSLTIITITYFTYQQIQYMNQQDLGFDQAQVLVLSIESNALQDKLSMLKAEIAKRKGVSAITSASAVPGVPGHNTFIADLEKEGEKKSIFLSHYYIDEDYLTTMGMNLTKGRNLQRTRATDTAAVLINETLVKRMGWENPLGKKIEVGEYLTVVGVFKDIHISSLHHAITPTILTYEYDHGRHQADQLLIRLNKEHLPETLAGIQAIWKNFEKKYPFEGYFLDTRFQKQYEQDQRQNKLLTLFSALTVLIACLGLFGLALFTTERRKKEICIRKILGASVKQVYFLVSNRFLGLILLASILSFPTAYIITDGWLQTFAYRIDIGSNWFVFVGALGICLLLSLFTISFQVIKVAKVNPVEMLKDE